jgi:hypothetical protein
MKFSKEVSQRSARKDGRATSWVIYLATLMAFIFFTATPTVIQLSAEAQTRKRSTQRGIELDSDDKIKQLPGNSKRWALIIGIDQYDNDVNSSMTLSGAVKDARSLQEALIKYAGFPAEQIVLLTSDQKGTLQPTRSNILAQLARLEDVVQPDDLLLFAFSGHGISSEGQAFLLPSNAQMLPNARYLRNEAVPVTEVKAFMAGVRQRILLLDACRNTLIGRGNGGTPLSEGFTKTFNFDRRNKDVDAFVVMYATKLGHKAYEDKKENMGYFTKAIVEGISGKAADEITGEVKLQALMRYVKGTVRNRTSLAEPEIQEPWWDSSGYAEDIVIAKVTPTAPKVVEPIAVPAPAVGMILIHTYPGAAKIAIKSEDGKVLPGTSSADGEFKISLAPGKYQVTASLEKYAAVTKEVIVKPGVPELTSMNLAAMTGSILLLGSFPPNVNILVNGSPASKISNADNLIELKDLSAGPYTVQISHPTTELWERKVVIKGGEQAKLVAALERRMTHLTIKSEPEAVIYIDDVPRAKLGSNGETTISVEPSSHKITIEKEGYNTLEQVKALVVGRAEVEMRLVRKPIKEVPVVKEAPASVVQSKQSALIVSTLSGINPITANVLIQSQDGSFRQEGMSAKGQYRLDLNPGLYEITVTAENYLPYKEKVTIEAGKPADLLPVNLSPTSGSILLLGSFKPEMEILLDGKAAAGAVRSENRIELKDVPAGMHKLQVQHQAFELWGEDINVTAGIPTPVSVAFKRKLTLLSVKSEPGAMIYVDNLPKDRVTESGDVKIPGIEPGQHKIRAEKEGYDPAEVAQTFDAGDAEITLTLKSSASALEFSDDFTQDLRSWSAPPAWLLSREKGNFGMLVSGPGFGLVKDMVNDRPGIYKDFTMEFDISFKNGKGAVWIVRQRDLRNYYMFQLFGPKGKYPNRFQSYICQDGVIKELKPAERVPEDLSRSNDSFHITLEVKGTEIKHKIRTNSAPKSGEPQTFGISQNLVFSQGGIGFGTKENEEFLVRWIGIVPERIK